LTNASTILPTTPANVTKYATQALQSLGVTIRYHTTVVNTSSLPDGTEQTLHFSNGETLITNMYIPAFGLLPNSAFVPSKYLNTDGFVTLDPYLKLKGTTNAWALGDVCDVEGMQALSCDRQSVYVAKSVVALLSGKNTMPYKPMASRKSIHRLN
jgi:NADH dehydrogenase FAD-containing subunit